MESPKRLTIADLIRRSRPHTASSSSVSPAPHANPTPTTSRNSSNPNPLTPLSHSAILTGTLTLPNHADPSPCPTNNCLRFSDASASVCCDVLHLDVRLIGTKFHVFAWNFIPLKRGCGGFLEIIKWGFSDSSSGLNRCSNVDSFRLALGSSSSSFGQDSKAKYQAHGALESIGPVSVVPCSIRTRTPQTDSGSRSLRGFLLHIMVCDCKLCCSKDAILGSNYAIQGQDNHFYNKPMFVYFCGFASSWHPVLTKFIGRVVTLSGLKKKLLYIGKEESQLMFVTTETSVLYLPRPSQTWLSCTNSIIKGKGECGVYTGLVRGVYMQGKVVELDEEVWLLLTDQLLTPPHSLRVGALVTLRNVHFVNPKFSWTKILILGACFKSSITVESFSPLETGCHLVSQSESLLGKFIESLAFSARLWALLLVSCFRKKFSGILSEKEILGTQHKEGLVQMYASSHLPPSVFRSRHGVFSELSKHDSCGCGTEPCVGDMKLVAPLSSFINLCERRTQIKPEDGHQLLHDNNEYILPSDWKFCSGSIKRIFPSESTSPVLLGNLKVSPSSGRLQLVDRTGSIDVLVPDLPSTWDTNSIYEVSDYTLVMEGMPEHMDNLGLLDKESFSCRNIFNSAPLSRERNLEMYIYFSMRSSACRIFPGIVWMDDIAEVECGKYHLLCVTHKFPLLQKCGSVTSNISSMFVEVIVMPWDLVLAEKDELLHSKEETRDQLKQPGGHCAGRNCQKNVSSKRCKINLTSSGVFASNLMDDIRNPCCEVRTSSNLSAEPSEKWVCHDSSSPCNIPCLATVRRYNNQSLTISGFLYHKKANKKIVGPKYSAQKVLLELNSDSVVKYQLLQIGGYYITKHSKDDSLCNLQDLDNARGVKVLTTTSTYMWSISFSCDDDLPHDSYNNINEVPSGDQIELSLQKCIGCSSGTCSDVCLHLSADIIDVLKAYLKESEDGLVRPAVSQEKIANGSLSSETTMAMLQLSSGSPNSSCLFPEGNLVSLHGYVVDVYNLDYSSADVNVSHGSIADYQLRSSQAVRSHVCIHVLVDHNNVKISGSLSRHACPIGFGPGVKATFHRVLDFGEQNSLMLTPVSFVTLNSIRVVNDHHDNRDSSLWGSSDKYNVASRDTVSSALISEFIQLSESRLVRLRCRVAAIHFLIMKKARRCLRSNVHPMPLPIDIPVACFVLDDGSSSCYCWASSERAATFLRLHEELPLKAFESSSWTLKWIGGVKSICGTIIYHLERILKKHHGVIVKNHGSLLDSSCQDLAISVSSESALDSSDESLLKFIVVNACSGTVLNVVGAAMDLDAVDRFERDHHIEMQTTMKSMKNIWATAVSYPNPLTEARNIIRELQNSCFIDETEASESKASMVGLCCLSGYVSKRMKLEVEEEADPDVDFTKLPPTQTHTHTTCLVILRSSGPEMILIIPILVLCLSLTTAIYCFTP